MTFEDAYIQGKREGGYHGFCWGMDRAHFDPPNYSEALKICLTKVPEQYHQVFTNGFKESWVFGVNEGEDYRHSPNESEELNLIPTFHCNQTYPGG